MTALLTSADLAGLIPPETLIQLTTSGVATSLDEAPIAAAAETEWETMWIYLGGRGFTRIDVVPDGWVKSTLVKMTIYRLYARRDEVNNATVDTSTSPSAVKSTYNRCLAELMLILNNPAIPVAGLSEPSDDTLPGGGTYVANCPIFTNKNRTL